MRTVQRYDGVLSCVAGQSRFGKTSGVLAEIRGAERVAIWDARPEYHLALRGELVTNLSDLKAALRRSWDGPGKFSYWGPRADFQDWSELVFHWAKLWPPVIVVEEWADVTGPAKGEAAWGELVRKVLYYGAHLYAITQRPQETDKTTWGNASTKRTYYFDLPLDQRYMGDVFGIDPGEIASLARHEWIERRAGFSRLYRGVNPAP